MPFNQLPGDRQAEAKAAEFASGRVIGLTEAVEHEGQEFRVDPETGIGHRDGDHLRLETDLDGDTPALELGAGDQIGTITAAFCAAWTDEPPPDELIKAPKLRGTKRGNEIFAPINEVRRHFGQIRATVSIRYEKQEPPDLPDGEILMAQGPR